MIKTLYLGRVIQLSLETVRLPGGRETELEIVRHPGGAAVVALDAQDRVCLLHQFRHAAGGYIWELPAGKIDNREPPLQTAQRELEEEAGCRAARWESLGDCVSSPGVLAEVIHLFLARDLTLVPPQAGPDEVFSVEWRPFDEVLHMVETGELRDCKSLAALFRASRKLQRSSS